MAEEALMDELGLRRGHIALLLAPSSLHFPVVSLGVLSLGAVLSTANPLLTPGELTDQARDSEPFLALTTAELVPKLGSLLPASRVVLVDQLLAGLDGHDAWAGASGTGRDDPTQDAAGRRYGSFPALPRPTHFSARTRPCSAPPTASATTSTAVGDFFFFLFTFLISEIQMHVVWIACIL